MATYLASPPSTSCPPSGGLAAPLHASSVHSVASCHGSAGGGGNGVPGETSPLAVRALGCRPDPTGGVPAPIQPHPDSGVPLPVSGVGVRVGVYIWNIGDLGVPIKAGFSHLNMGGLSVTGGHPSCMRGRWSSAGSGERGLDPCLLPSWLGCVSFLGFPLLLSWIPRPFVDFGVHLSSLLSRCLAPILGFFFKLFGGSLCCTVFSRRLSGEEFFFIVLRHPWGYPWAFVFLCLLLLIGAAS